MIVAWVSTRKLEAIADARDIAANYAKRWQVDEGFRIIKWKRIDI